MSDLEAASRRPVGARAVATAKAEPGHSPKRLKHIVLSFPLRQDPWQDVVRGVYRYAESRALWAVAFHSDEEVAPALATRPDGVIALIRTADAARQLRGWGGPVVSAGVEVDEVPFAHVGFDWQAVGAVAADHLLQFSGRPVVGIGSVGSRAGRLLPEGFADRLRRKGAEAIEVPAALSRAAETGPVGAAALAAWLKTLGRPAAVFAYFDDLAHRLAAACVAAGLAVPREVAILGCGNDEFLCTVSRPALSSIRLPFAALGYEAARTLDALMAGAAIASRTELLPLGIAIRLSTDPAALADPELAAALRFIRENIRSKIGVEDIAAAGALSRSTLERRFRAVLGQSPLAALLRERIERAKQLLLETDLSLKEVARDAGFHDVRHLSVTFREKVGTAPGQYRTHLRSG